ncbi:Maf family protein [Serratia symbiotica]|uniref:Maf family protein n=1 Tax=Serratia symbiotica TaxID=138074 RepID=UPI001D5A956E|nr:Maf family protein [Serratia symbiotica]MCX2957414.1 Maf family protein [Serratia symbiotica]NIG87227.1 septum formation inhibitor Maf [Serratia symbiotica]USS95457.1 Maf family protein [Serratia symbiotica]
MIALYLASGSPRRHELLTLLGVPFDILLTHTIEQRQEGEAAAYVCRLAQDKAKAGVMLAPQDLPLLGTLSGKQHQVMTAVAIADRHKVLCQRVVTDVTFRNLSPRDIRDYIATGEPMNKAGAYGIQGKSGCFVRTITGSYHAVMGLPLVETHELLSNFVALGDVRAN